MTLHLAAYAAAIGGSLLVLWLLLSIWRESRRQQTPDYRAHTWLVDEHREALKAASAPRLYKGYRMPPDPDQIGR